MNFDESRLVKVVKPEMVRCRPGDWEHCQRVVGWVKKLGRGRKDLPLLVTAAYIHDIGWRDLVPAGFKMTKDKVLKLLDKEATENTEKNARPLLEKLGFSEIEIAENLRLVRASETYRSRNDDEAILVEADCLSKTSIDHLKQKYVKSDWLKMYDFWKEFLPSRMKTEKGKRWFASRMRLLRRDITAELKKD